MFSKAKRFEPLGKGKNLTKSANKPEAEQSNVVSKCKSNALPSHKSHQNFDTKSHCSSTSSVKSFVTPRPTKLAIKTQNSLKKTQPITKNNDSKNPLKYHDDIIKAQEVEIRNKDYTITEYNKQIEELKNEIATLQEQFKKNSSNIDCKELNQQFSEITLGDERKKSEDNTNNDYTHTISALQQKIINLERQCEILEAEICHKQVDLTSMEEVVTIRDSLCKDLQEKLTNIETILEETRQRLEMVKGHHSLALEANESIRREYKAELETLKSKMEEEKQTIISKHKAEQDNLKAKYISLIEETKCELSNEKDKIVEELQQRITKKDQEIKAKLEQIDEATQEKLKLCEIQFEERSRNIQEHWNQQQNRVIYLEKEIKDLEYTLNLTEEKNLSLNKEISDLKKENESLRIENSDISKEMDEIKEESKKKCIDFENEINKLTLEVDITNKEKHKFEMSLSVTRDIVHVLTMRLRESDNELEHLEDKMQELSNSKEILENELVSYKNTLNNTVLECNEYREALVNILKSKAALAKEHNRIMEHNVTLLESLQNVEKEAYRELGTIKNELIEDVELLKKESNSQIQLLKEEVEKKRLLCELAKEHAGQATAAAEQSRVLIAQAAAEISRIEEENKRLQQQIHDQQSIVVELSLLRQENEELTITLAKQASIIDKLKREKEQTSIKPKSPSVVRKSHKVGKENMQTIISPLRERNQLI